jgi:hypothetical protein
LCATGGQRRGRSSERDEELHLLSGSDKTWYDKLVERMLKLHKDSPKAKTPHEQERSIPTIADTQRSMKELTE